MQKNKKTKITEKFLMTPFFSFTYQDILTVLEYEIEDNNLKLIPTKEMLERVAERLSFDAIDEHFNEEVTDSFGAEY